MPRQANNRQVAALLLAKIAQQVQQGANKGLDAARVFLTSRVREAVSEPAPKRAVRGRPGPGKKQGAILYYVATQPAKQGAPPRVLSGKLRQSIWSKMLNANTAVIGANARGDNGVNYPAILERSQDPKRAHPFILPTIEKFKDEIKTILGRELKVSVGNQ